MIYLDEQGCRELLFPFTHMRHVADIPLGLFSIREKWERLTALSVSTDPLLKGQAQYVLPAHWIPNQENFEMMLQHAAAPSGSWTPDEQNILKYPWHIFELNDACIRSDFQLLERLNQYFPENNQYVGKDQIFIEAGARLHHCILNATTGPIYISLNAEIMEGALIRGPFYLGENSVVKMGAKIYGATSIGPNCVVGGEVKNSVIFGNSNKAHDGYLGDAVVGEWCNLGAGSSNSNIKNNASSVKYDLEGQAKPLQAGLKGGLLMGDYSRSAINTRFNTAAVVGVGCNIFGDQMITGNTGHFRWGKERYVFEKLLQDINNWMRFKGKQLDIYAIEKLTQLYQTNF